MPGDVTHLSVVLSELVPKALTVQRAGGAAALVARPVDLLSRLLAAVAWVLERSAGFVLRPLGVREVIAHEGIRRVDEPRARLPTRARAPV